MLFGRATERARIERLLDDAREGRSGVLVLCGEPGIGKTALLEYARELATSMTVVTATGIEAEAQVEYSGLLELTRPLLHVMGEIPEHQADALRDALGLAPPSARDPYAVGAALLSLVAAAAEEHPCLVLVDDAHWLDRASADALRFAARRLFADRVAFVFAVRIHEGFAFDTDGLETLDITGLAPDDANELLLRSGIGDLPDDVLRDVHDATGGNPLALTELGELIAPEQLEAWRVRGEPLPVGTAVQEAFARRARGLPADTRTALVLSAAASTSDVTVIDDALSGLGLSLSALEPAEDAGLVSLVAGNVAFRHPLVRSAIHHSTPMSERRSAHAVLAEAFARQGQDDRRAWHLAAASLGTDESIAAELDAIAARSRERGAHAAAAAALEQAARLTPEQTKRLDRLVRAAETAWLGGSPTTGLSLLEEALSLCHDDLSRSRVLALHGRIEGEVGEQGWARDLLLEAASLVEGTDPRAAASILLIATAPLYFGGDVAGSLATAERARALLPRDGGQLDTRADACLGWALSHAGRGDEAEPVLTRALDKLLAADARPSQPALQNARLALDILERMSEAHQLWPAVDEIARADGPVALLGALEQETRFLVRAGEWGRAVASGEEALEIARALGHVVDQARLHVLLAVVDAGRGDDTSCQARRALALESTQRHGLEVLASTIGAVRGLLELGLGRLEEAASILEDVARSSEARGLFARDVSPEPDLVEALAGLGRADEARAWLDAYEGRASRASPGWGAALAARCRGMLDDDFERHFVTALELHAVVPDRFQEARTLLAFGERLRREARKREARVHLGEAAELFELLEATPWIMRTRRELRATGQKLGRRTAAPGDELTPQELQVALQVAEGKTNKEVGAALFLSPKTVEFHLARVYRKLDLNSRAELIRHFAAGEATAGVMGEVSR